MSEFLGFSFNSVVRHAPSFSASSYSNNYRENSIVSRTFTIDDGHTDTTLVATSSSTYIDSVSVSGNNATVTLNLANVVGDQTAVVDLTIMNAFGSDTATWTIFIVEAGAMWSQTAYDYEWDDSEGTQTVQLGSLVSGIPTPTYAFVGTQPSGVTLSGSTLSIDTATYTGGSFAIRATNGNGSDDADFNVTINQAFWSSQVFATTYAEGTYSHGEFSSFIQETGLVFTYEYSGSLLTNIVIQNDNTIWFTIGLVDADTVETMTLILTDSEGNEQTATWSITVENAAAGTGVVPEWIFLPNQDTPSTGVQSGTNFGINLDEYVAGNPAPTITVESGTVPSYLSLSGSRLEGFIPSSASNTTFELTFRATNEHGHDISEAYRVYIN